MTGASPELCTHVLEAICFRSPCPISCLISWPGAYLAWIPCGPRPGTQHPPLRLCSGPAWWRRRWTLWARLLPRSPCRWRFCPRAARAPSSSNSSRTGNEGGRLPDPRLPTFSSSGCLVSAEVPLRLFNKGDEAFPSSQLSALLSQLSALTPALSSSSLPCQPPGLIHALRQRGPSGHPLPRPGAGADSARSS